MSATALELYCRDVVSGRQTACAKVRALCERLLSDIAGGCGRWHFDRRAAERPVEFVERFCRVPSGKLGAPMRLEPYEKAWIESMFGFVDDAGNRRVREALVTVGRKNGKTSLAAALELYMLTSDGEGSPQVYNVATTEDQARLGFNAACKMRAMSPEIARAVKKRRDDLWCEANFGYIRPLTGNPSSMDGLDCHFGVLDEIHAMRDRDVYDLLRQATGARRNPLILCITTNGFVRSSIFDSQYAYAADWLNGKVDDDRFVAWMYELDDKSEWDDEACWAKANPGLGTVKSESYMREQVAKARQDPAYKPTVLTKDFNMPENAAQAWLSFDEAVNPVTVGDMSEMGFKYGICGFDASDSVDLTSAQMLMKRPDDDKIYELSMYWIPQAVMDEQDKMGRHERDRAPYRRWIERGLMRTVPGNKIDKRVLLDWLEEVRDEYDVYTWALGFDPWHMTEDKLVADLEAYVGASRVVRVRQGARTLSAPMKQLRADYQAHRIIDNHNPVNEWCRMNVMAKSDVNGNIQPVKLDGNKLNRIDGFAAELDAYVVLANRLEEYEQVC